MDHRSTRRAGATVTSFVALGLALTACATGAPMPEQSSSRPPFQTTTPGAIAPTGSPAAVPPAQWTAIQDDLAARGVSTAPTLISSESVTFSDGSLGCAEPGQSYTQALVDGMRVVVEADGETYDYRIAEGTLKLCTR